MARLSVGAASSTGPACGGHACIGRGDVALSKVDRNTYLFTENVIVHDKLERINT